MEYPENTEYPEYSEYSEYQEYIIHYLLIFIEDDSFWEPIKVGLTYNELNKLICAYTKKKECLICRDDRRLYKVVHCCKNMICMEMELKNKLFYI